MLQRLKRCLLLALDNLFAEPSLAPEAASEAIVSKQPTKHSKGLIFLFVFLVLAIFALAFIYYHKQLSLVAAPQEQREQLQAEYESLEQEQAELLLEEEKLEQNFADLRNELLISLGEDSAEYAELVEKMQLARSVAGLEEAVGPALTISLEDAPGIKYDHTTNSSEIIHDADVHFIVDWLKSKYVAALAVNNERLAPMSKLICTGPSILVNRVYQSSPFVVQAVSEDAEQLAKEIEKSPDLARMRERGLQITIEFHEELILPGQDDYTYITQQIENLQ